MNINVSYYKKDIIDRLKEYIEFEAMVAPSVFASYAGLDPSGFLRSLRTNKITKKTLIKISEAYDLSLEWLIDGVGDSKVANPKNELSEFRPRIPMSATAGSVSGFAEGIAEYQCEQVPVVLAFPSYDFTITVNGDSMIPKFECGDELAITKVKDVIEWGKTYVLDTRDGAILKRLYDADDKYKCVSYNPEYPDFEVSKEDVFGVYKVVGMLRVGL